MNKNYQPASPAVEVASEKPVVAGLSDEQISAVAKSMQFKPWGIGSHHRDAIAFGRALLALATTSTAPAAVTEAPVYESVRDAASAVYNAAVAVPGSLSDAQIEAAWPKNAHGLGCLTHLNVKQVRNELIRALATTSTVDPYMQTR